MKKTLKYILLLPLITLVSCSEKKSDKKTVVIEHYNNNIWKTPKDYSPTSLIMEVANGENNKTLTLADEFPLNWVEKKDIEPLINLISNTEKCKCLLNPLSSKIPINDFAQIGGYARIFIESYKDAKEIQLGLYSCPKVDLDINKDLIDWWKEEKVK